MRIRTDAQATMIIVISIVLSVLVYFFLDQFIEESRLLNAMVVIVPLIVAPWARYQKGKQV